MKNQVKSAIDNRQSAIHRSLALAALLALGLGATARAASVTWDADTGAAGAQDGGGTWSTSGDWNTDGYGWWNTTTSANVNWTNGDVATFGSGSGTTGTHAITLGSDVTVSTGTTAAGSVLLFASPGSYTLSATDTQKSIGIVTANVTSNIVVAKNVTATIGDKVRISRPAEAANRGQISLYGGATASTTDGGTLVVGSGTEGGNAELVNYSLSHLIEVRQGLSLEVKKGGAFTSNSSMVLGSTTGTESNHTNNLKITGGTVNVGAPTVGNFVIGNNNNAAHTSTSIVTISDGTLTIHSTSAGSYGLRFGSTVSNASYVANGTFHLDGGVVMLGRIYEGAATGGAVINSTFNFNGGELKVLAGTSNAATFMTGIDTARVRAGGARIHTNGVDTTVAQALVHDTALDVITPTPDGGLEKRGSGTLFLTNTNTYTGATTVTTGTLSLGNGTANTGLADGADVIVAGGATLNLNYLAANTDIVDELWINGVQKSPGVYGASDPSGQITGTGTLTVSNGPTGTPFSTWISSNYPGLTGDDAKPGADPDGDGTNNLVEFALHGDPSSASDNGYMVVATEDADGDIVPELTLTIAVRNGSGTPTFAGSPVPSATVDKVKYSIQGSLDLAFPSGAAVSETAAPTGLPALPSGWEYRRFMLNDSEGLPDKGFLRVKVEEVP